MLLLWDVEEGLAKIDKYLYSNDDNVKVKFRSPFYFYLPPPSIFFSS